MAMVTPDWLLELKLAVGGLKGNHERNFGAGRSRVGDFNVDLNQTGDQARRRSGITEP